VKVMSIMKLRTNVRQYCSVQYRMTSSNCCLYQNEKYLSCPCHGKMADKDMSFWQLAMVEFPAKENIST
jgi:hypothetical protein